MPFIDDALHVNILHTITYVHGAEDEKTDEKPVAHLEQAVPAAAHVVGGGDPHRHRAQAGHPPHRNIDAPVTRLHVDGLPHGMPPSLRPNTVSNEQKCVNEYGSEGEVARDGVVEYGSLEGHSDGGPNLAVSGDRYKDDGKVGGAHESHVEGDRP